MANHASAIKAHRQSLVNRERNRQYRSKLRTALKNVRAALASGKTDEVKQSFSGTVSLIDKLVDEGHHSPQRRGPLQVAADEEAGVASRTPRGHASRSTAQRPSGRARVQHFLSPMNPAT